MTTVVLVPWRGGNDHREAAWAFVRRQWEAFGFPIVTADRPGPFSRSGSRNLAAELAGAWDVAIVVDADTFVRDRGPVLEAIDRAAATGRLVIPHDDFVGLDATGSRLVLDGRRSGWSHVGKRVDGAPLGVIVVPRSAWLTLGGFDERFTGWGGEDVAFARAARTLVGVDRLPGQIWHLWHPRDATKAAYLEGPKDLVTRYAEALGRPEAMLELLAGREAVAA